MALFVLFVMRLCFGLALGMAITSPRQVASGYYRNNLYVTLGLTSLAALLSRAVAPGLFWYAVAAATFSYVGSVCWLYEKPNPGRVLLAAIALASFLGTQHLSSALLGAHGDRVLEKYTQSSAEVQFSAADAGNLTPRARQIGFASGILQVISNTSSGLLLGLTMAAMLLGHWYLNSPTMQLSPLWRLIAAMGVAVGLQVVVSSLGLWGEVASVQALTTQWTLFVVLRWCFGLVGVGLLTWMAWQTLKIPNTQSATGILYVAVIGTFVGETMSLLLSAESIFPL